MGTEIRRTYFRKYDVNNDGGDGAIYYRNWAYVPCGRSEADLILISGGIENIVLESENCTTLTREQQQLLARVAIAKGRLPIELQAQARRAANLEY